MAWTDFYQRQRAIRATLEHASRYPDDSLEPAPELFADTDELLAALQYRWTQTLVGHLDVALGEVEAEPHADRVQAATSAWRNTAAANPVLRAVLDRHGEQPGPRLRSALVREQRLVALTSGLAEDTEPGETVTRVGGAFLHLVRAIEPPAASRCAVPALRRLIPNF